MLEHALPIKGVFSGDTFLNFESLLLSSFLQDPADFQPLSDEELKTCRSVVVFQRSKILASDETAADVKAKLLKETGAWFVQDLESKVVEEWLAFVASHIAD